MVLVAQQGRSISWLDVLSEHHHHIGFAKFVIFLVCHFSCRYLLFSLNLQKIILFLFSSKIAEHLI